MNFKSVSQIISKPLIQKLHPFGVKDHQFWGLIDHFLYLSPLPKINKKTNREKKAEAPFGRHTCQDIPSKFPRNRPIDKGTVFFQIMLPE